MKQDELQEQYLKDFDKIRGALLSQISNNARLDETLMERFAEEDYSNLEEHTMMSKIILDSTKVLSEAYKNAPAILNEIEKQDSKTQKTKFNLDKLLDED